MYIYVRMYVNITYVIVTATRCYSIGGLPDDLCINLHNGQYTYLLCKHIPRGKGVLSMQQAPLIRNSPQGLQKSSCA